MNSIQSSYSLIKQKLEAGEWLPGTRMPSLAILAKTCSVSRTTMWRALSLLQKGSFVYAKTRGAIIAGPPGTIETVIDKKESPAPGPFWKRLAATMGRDVLSGAFPHFLLPPVTKLAAHYGVSTPTLYKALNQLKADGIIIPEGRKFRQVRGEHRQHQQTIVFITVTDVNGDINADDLRTHTLVQSIEREGPARGFDVRCEGFNAQSVTGFMDLSAKIRSIKNIAGCIVNIWNPWDKTIWQRWVDILVFLADLHAPVIIIDQAADLDFPPSLLRCGQVKIFRISSVNAGIRVAEALHRRGHERIAFVGRDLGAGWEKARYEGVSAYFRQYGGAHASVTRFSRDKSMSNFELMIALLDLDEEGFRALHYEQFSEERIRSLYPYLQRVHDLKIRNIVSDTVISETLSPFIDVLKSLVKKTHDPRTLIRFQGLTGSIASDRGAELWLAPLFNAILKKRDITAWVFSSDQAALAALSFLQKEKVPVPEEISVIGFDNWREAYEHQLSTFDFNMHGIIQESLLMIMDEKHLRARPVISEIEGYVVERRTTTRVQRSGYRK